MFILVSDYSTQQLSDRSDKQDYQQQQQFGLMNDHSVMDVMDTQDHQSEFSPRGGGQPALSFSPGIYCLYARVHRSLTISECAAFVTFLGFLCRTLKKSLTFYKVKCRCPFFKVQFCHFSPLKN